DYENTPLTVTGSGIIRDFRSAFNNDSTLIGSETDDEIYGYDGNDTLIGGKGNDTLYGGSGNDTYIFNLGDGIDTISEDSSSSSLDRIVFGEGITAEDITVTREDYDMILNIGDGSDSIRIQNFFDRRWSSDYRVENFVFNDGSEGYVDVYTNELILTKQPDSIEEDIEQTNAELLNEIYSDDEFGADIFENDSTIISEVTDSITVSDDTDEVSDMTDIQTMILAENMSAFADDSNVYDNANITDITADTVALDQLLVSSVQ
ncbi:MAG: hypothetical protein GXY08_09720, partial [Ruminococcus sp.]|nr:hypothetical protein [Ruminococcus sp.]